MDTKEALTPADFAAVDEAARVLARVARRLGVDCIGLAVFADESTHVHTTAPKNGEGWASEDGELPSAALARRLGSAAVTTPDLDLLARIARGEDVIVPWSEGGAAVLEKLDVLRAHRLIDGAGVADKRRLTDAGRAYLDARPATKPPSKTGERR